MSTPLAALEEVRGGSGVPPRTEALLAARVRHRQLQVRTLILGMMLTLADRRPAHLTGVHAALTALPGPEQARPGVTEEWAAGPHQLAYRQVERTSGLVTDALGKDKPDGTPSAALGAVLDDLLEASIPPGHTKTSASLAADWTDVESFSRPPHRGSTACADPEASWGHRNSSLPGPKGELFFGYYHSTATMTREETGPPVPELTRRMTLSSGDVLADSGYAHRDAAAWAIPLRTAGARLVQDLHPAGRGPKGTCHGAIIATATSTAPPPPGRCFSSARWLPPPPRTTPPRTTPRPPNCPGTSPVASPPATPTATTTPPVPPSQARSAAPSGPAR